MFLPHLSFCDPKLDLKKFKKLDLEIQKNIQAGNTCKTLFKAKNVLEIFI